MLAEQRELEVMLVIPTTVDFDLAVKLLQADLAQAIVWQDWDRTELDFGETTIGVIVESAGTAAGLFSVGYVLWAFRAGAIMTALSTGRGTWAAVDPSALLSSYRGSEAKKDEIDQMLG